MNSMLCHLNVNSFTLEIYNKRKKFVFGQCVMTFVAIDWQGTVG